MPLVITICINSFAIIPAGTGNDFARSLNIPMNLDEAFESLSSGTINYVDLGIINDRICFACAMSLGFGPEVTKNATQKLKCLFGRGALYLGACLYMLRPKRLYHIRSIINRERVQRIKTPHLVIGNGKYHGGGFPISPVSHLQNAHLDLYYFKPVGLRQLSRLLYKVFFRNQDHTLLEEVTHRQIKEMQMWLSQPLDVDIDGDIHRFYRQIQVSVKPGALKVLAPTVAALQDKPIHSFARKLVGRHRRAS
jgi:diacylglycerol kinase family enzyme